MTSSTWHWHLVNREALQVSPEPFNSVPGYPGSISGVFHAQVGWECRVDVLTTMDIKTGRQERGAPPSHIPSPTEASFGERNSL